MATKATPAKTPKPAAKPGAKAAAAAKPKPESATQAPAAKDPAKVTVGLRLKGLVDRVTEVSGAKRKDVKPIIDAALAEMGAVLARGEPLSLPGLGHLRVARKATEASPVMTLKLRQGEPGGKAKAGAEDSDAMDEKDTLAEGSDQG